MKLWIATLVSLWSFTALAQTSGSATDALLLSMHQQLTTQATALQGIESLLEEDLASDCAGQARWQRFFTSGCTEFSGRLAQALAQWGDSLRSDGWSQQARALMTALKSSPASPLTSSYVDFFELGAQDWKAGAQRSLQALAPTLVRCQAIDEGYFGDTGRARVDCLMSFWIEQRSQAGWLQASLEDLIGVTEDFRMGLVD